MIYVGLDFGTSNSSIARLQNGGIKLFSVDHGNSTQHLLRSFLYLDKAYNHFTGSKAILKYLENETGRPVFWETRYVGMVENVWAGVPSTDGDPIFTENEVVVEVDVSAKGRLLQSIKTGLRGGGEKRIRIFDRVYPIQDLIAMLMGRLREACETELGESVEGVVIGRPVRFSSDPDQDRKAHDRLWEAGKLAGFKDIRFEYEPVAAAYVHHSQAVKREIVLVFDFGGGTLDLTVMEVGGAETPRTLATQGALVGGDDLDRALMRPVKKVFGEGARLRNGTPLPGHVLDSLETWQNMVELSRPRYRQMFREARAGTHPEAIRQLESLVNNNLGFRLAQELEQAKIRLSTEESTLITFQHDGVNLRERITRQHFERLIRPELQIAREAVDEVLRKSGLTADSIGAVLRTGGSAEVPAFINLLVETFGEEKMRELSPFTSIVGGLAIKAGELGK